MRPPPVSRIAATAAREPCITPSRLTPTICSTCASGCSHALHVQATPALLTQTLSRPERCRARRRRGVTRGRAHVELEADGAVADRRGGLVDGVDVDVGEHDAHAAAGEPARYLQPEAARRTL